MLLKIVGPSALGPSGRLNGKDSTVPAMTCAGALQEPMSCPTARILPRRCKLSELLPIVVGKVVEGIVKHTLESKGGLLDELERNSYPIQIGLSGTLQGIPYEPLAYDPVYHESWGWRYFEQGLIESQAEWFEAACVAFERAFDQSNSLAVVSQVYCLWWQALAKAEAARRWEAERQRGTFQYAHSLMERARELAEEIAEEDPDRQILGYTHRLHGFVYHRQGGKWDEAWDKYDEAKKEGYKSRRLKKHMDMANDEEELSSNMLAGMSNRLVRIPTHVSISILLAALAVAVLFHLFHLLSLVTADDWWRALGVVAINLVLTVVFVVVFTTVWKAVNRWLISRSSHRREPPGLEHWFSGGPSLPSSRVRDEAGGPLVSERD